MFYKPFDSLAKSQNTPMILLSSVVMVIIIWQSLNFWQVSLWQETLLEKLQITQHKNKMISKPLLNKTPSISPRQSKPLSLIQVDLPEVPEIAKKADTIKANNTTISEGVKKTSQNNRINDGKNNNQNNNEKLTPTVTSKETSQKAQKIKPVQKDLNEQVTKQVTPLNKPTANVSMIYQQLSTDPRINIEIAWPDNTTQRRNIFSFLYQCVGMKFGVMSNDNKNQQSVMLAKNPYFPNSISNNNNSNNKISDWLRIAQGKLASQEQQWLQQYDLSGMPVRLFPKRVDWQLAKLISMALNTEQLKSFRARYKQQGHQFMLTDISLNGRLITNDWILITKKCTG